MSSVVHTRELYYCIRMSAISEIRGFVGGAESGTLSRPVVLNAIRTFFDGLIIKSLVVIAHDMGASGR